MKEVKELFAETLMQQDWPDGLLALDTQHQIVALSPKASLILGWTSEQVVGRHVHDMLCASNRELHHSLSDCPFTQLNYEPKDTHSGYWQSRDGTLLGIDYRLIKSTQAELGWILSFHVNTDKQHSQYELNKFAQYVDNSPTPMAEFDLSGQMVFANPAMHELLLKEGFNDLGEARIYPKNLTELCAGVDAGQQPISETVEVNERWYLWHFFIIESIGERSNLTYIFDVTESKRTAKRIEKEKAEARRDFYAKMVHELRTPLNAIVGFSQILLRRCETTLEQRDIKNLQAILAAGIQLNEMVSDTLDISKIDAGKMQLELEEFQPKAILESIFDQLNALAETKSLLLTMTCDDNLLLTSDLKKTRQIMVNLISNAIKYTHEGSVNVCLLKSQENNTKGGIEFSVSDTGVGIAENQIEKLFGAYQQVSETQNRHIQGTGLGLALVAELVAMLGGSIDVSSQVGVGSHFQVHLPQIKAVDTDSSSVA